MTISSKVSLSGKTYHEAQFPCSPVSSTNVASRWLGDVVLLANDFEFGGGGCRAFNSPTDPLPDCLLAALRAASLPLVRGKPHATLRDTI